MKKYLVLILLLPTFAFATFFGNPQQTKHGGTGTDSSAASGIPHLSAGSWTYSALVGADLPNPSAGSLGGTESITCSSHEWLEQISTSGIPSCTQPAFSDVSGSVTAAQMLALASGDVYIGNGSNQPVAAALTAGSGITITPSAGAITIAATGGGSGTVTSVSIVSANGLAGTVATSTTTPAITMSTSVSGIVKANGAAFSAATGDTDYQNPISLGAFGSTPNADGLSFSSDVLNMQPADSTHPGGVSIAAQTLAGAKTFSSAPILSSLTATTPLALDSSKNIISGSYSGNTTKVATASGTLTSGDCVKFDASGNVIDAGAPCGGGGGSTVYNAQFQCGMGTGDANTTLLLNFDGGVSGGFSSSTIYDYSSAHLTGWSLNLGAVMDTTHPKFGVAAVDFTVGSSGANISVAGNAAFALGAGNFELDAQVYPVNFSATYDVMGVQNSGVGGWDLYINTSGFPVWYNSSLGNILVGTTALTLNAYNNVEVDRSSTTVYIFVNGVLSGTATDVSVYSDSSDTFHVGANSTAAGQANGLFVDEVRISNIARNTVSFTPPSAAWQISQVIDANGNPGSWMSYVAGGFGPGWCQIIPSSAFSALPACSFSPITTTVNSGTLPTQTPTTSAYSMFTYINGVIANNDVIGSCH